MIIKYIYRKSEQPSYGWYHPCFVCYNYTSQYIILNRIENVFNLYENNLPINYNNTILSNINNNGETDNGESELLVSFVSDSPNQ